MDISNDFEILIEKVFKYMNARNNFISSKTKQWQWSREGTIYAGRTYLVLAHVGGSLEKLVKDFKLNSVPKISNNY